MAFITNRIGQLEYLTAENIGVPHCFSTRFGGVSSGYLASLNLGFHREDAPENVAQNYRILGEAVGFSLSDIVAAKQIHSDIVYVATAADREKCMVEGASPVCDALITNEPGVALNVFTADCTPILYHDPVTGAVGAAHAGWRGTAAGIAAKTVQAMVDAYGCKPENIRAAIGPHIGPCCFETDWDVPQAMLDALGEEARPFIERRGDKYYVNLTEVNSLFLRRAGVVHISASADCTACQPDRFWSYRRVGTRRGAQGAIILCTKEVSP